MFPNKLWVNFTFNIISQKNIGLAVKNLQTSLDKYLIIGIDNKYYVN